MEQGVLTPFQRALDVIEQLSVEDQATLIEIIGRRLVEQRRTPLVDQRWEEIAAHARATLEAFREGRARCGTVDDLRRDLLDED
jgi:hypothetical protein